MPAAFKFHKKLIKDPSGKEENYWAICDKKDCEFLSKRSIRAKDMPKDQYMVRVFGFACVFIYLFFALQKHKHKHKHTNTNTNTNTQCIACPNWSHDQCGKRGEVEINEGALCIECMQGANPRKWGGLRNFEVHYFEVTFFCLFFFCELFLFYFILFYCIDLVMRTPLASK